jgi:signal transduction histidine kinase
MSSSTRTFPNDPTAVRGARQFALQQLSGSAAVLHTDSTSFTLNVESDRQSIRLSVTDQGSGRPEVQGLDPHRLSGRGLALVEMFSRDWGVQESRSADGGKTVWVVLDADEARNPGGSRSRTLA